MPKKKPTKGKKDKTHPKKEFKEETTPAKENSKEEKKSKKDVKQPKVKKKDYKEGLPPEEETEIVCKACRQIISEGKFVDDRIENLPYPFEDKFMVVNKTDNVYIGQLCENIADAAQHPAPSGLIKNLFCNQCRKKVGVIIEKSENEALNRIGRRDVLARSRVLTIPLKDKVQSKLGWSKKQRVEEEEKQPKKTKSPKEAKAKLSDGYQSAPATELTIHMVDRSIQLSNKRPVREKEEIKEMKEVAVGNSMIVQQEAAEVNEKEKEQQAEKEEIKQEVEKRQSREESKERKVSKQLQTHAPGIQNSNQENLDEFLQQEGCMEITPGKIRERVTELRKRFAKGDFTSQDREEMQLCMAVEWVGEIEAAIDSIRQRIKVQRDLVQRMTRYHEPPPVRIRPNGKRVIGQNRDPQLVDRIQLPKQEGVLVINFHNLKSSKLKPKLKEK